MSVRCAGCMRLKEQRPICEHCGYDDRRENNTHQLPVGTVVGGHFTLGRVLGQGGFGITYLGWDSVLKCPVAVKEFFPSGYAGRDTRNSRMVTGYDSDGAPAFEANKNRFLREAEALAKLWGVPQIVKVLRFFEENGTAYIALEYIEGENLLEYMKRHNRPLTVEELLELLGPVMQALVRVHQVNLVHRDISPDNIMVLPDGTTKLLDFGAARYVENADAARERNTSTQAILKHGFAPPEQYSSHGALGPWSDVYALCATIYFCLTGQKPIEAMNRIIDDQQLGWEKIPGLTRRQINVLNQGMELKPQNRIQSVQQLYDELFGEILEAREKAKQEAEAEAKRREERRQETDQMKIERTEARKDRKKHHGQHRKKGFLALVAVILVVAVVVGATLVMNKSSIREKNTIALTVGNYELNSVEMNYFFMDSVNNFYSQYGSYAAMLGLDVTKPLNEQFVDEAAGLTWADDFMTSAKESAASVYALTDAAEAAGFTLPEAEKEALTINMENLELYAAMYGYGNVNQYLKAMYGNGASEETYEAYCAKQALASAYYNSYAESLTYEDADLRAAEAENFNAYSSYTYNTYYLATSRFLTGGTTNVEGTTTYSDEEKAASVAAAEEAAKALTGEDIKNASDLDAAIAALEINKDTEAASTYNEDTLYSYLTASYQEWIADSSRKAGDTAYFPSTSGDTVTGYHVVMFHSSNDNTFALKNVRHILVAPAHEHVEGETHAEGETYSAEELAAAKATAEEILASWQAGEATEEAFAALANEKSADGDGTTGGLYENVYPGQMVEAFEAWCYEDSRKAGDTGIVETQYGYHVMYFVGDSEMTYRDFQIENQLRSADLDTWYTELVAAMPQTEGDTQYIPKDLVLSVS